MWARVRRHAKGEYMASRADACPLFVVTHPYYAMTDLRVFSGKQVRLKPLRGDAHGIPVTDVTRRFVDGQIDARWCSAT
jgi:hypothetical protein